jgi:diguanylate cyclase (GGDEF)-like protein
VNASPGALALAALVGLGIGVVAFRNRRRSAGSGGDQPVPPPDLAFLLSLLRRAHGARAAWVVGLPDGDAYVDDEARPVEAVYGRGLSLARLAANDARIQTTTDDAGVFVALGAFPLGAAVLLSGTAVEPSAIEALGADLRRLLAGLEASADDPRRSVATRLAELAATAPSVEGIAHTAAELASRDADGPAVVVARTVAHPTGEIVALSRGADRRLLARPLPADSAAARSMENGVPIVAQPGEDVLGGGDGHGAADRRQRLRAMVAIPVLDGASAVGAVVLFGEDEPGPARADRLAAVQQVAADLAPRLAAALAVRDAEAKAVTDPLTGLPNRRALEQELARPRTEAQPVALLYVDLDHFKRINDKLGHPAGDAALRHVTRLLQAAVRDVDLVARVGGEEFAVWLPGASLEKGVEIAGRIRQAVEQSQWFWLGTPRALACSIGVAAYPGMVHDVANLPSVADAALYRAKHGGRNRVETGGAAD